MLPVDESSLRDLRVFVVCRRYGESEPSAREAMHVQRPPVGIERDGPILIGSEDRRTNVAVSLYHLRGGMPEVVAPTDTEDDDLGTKRAHKIHAARSQAAVVWRFQHAQG